MVKVISIQDDVYEELSKRKDNKSFSQVIRSLINSSRRDVTAGDLEKYLGILTRKEAEGIEEDVLEGRKRAKERNLGEM